MRRLPFCLAGLLAAVVAINASSIAQAQNRLNNGATSRPAGGDNRGQGLDRFRKAIESLDLTADQQEKVRQLMAQTREKFQALRQSSSGDREEMRSKAAPILQDLFTQMKAILTPAQQEKLRAAIQEGRGPSSEPAATQPINNNATIHAAPTSVPAADAGPMIGEIAPAFTLKTLDGSSISASQLRGKTVLLVFGCASSPTFREHAPALEKLSRDYAGKLSTVVIYTREIHAAGEWEVDRNKDQNISIDQPANAAARAARAQQTRQSLKLSMPFAVDSMDDATAKAYGDTENAAYLIGKDGVVLVHQKWFEPYALRRDVDALNADVHAMGD